MNRFRFAAAALFFAAIHHAALANAGTALMWAAWNYRFIGNFLTGVLEGILLVIFFKASKWFSLPAMIIANFISFYAGGLLMIKWLSPLPDITFENLQFWFWTFVILAFVVTVAVEWPIIWLVSQKGRGRFTRSVRSALLIHILSYAILFGYFWLFSGTTFLTKMKVVAAGEMGIINGYDLYFISPEGDRLLKIDLEKPETIHSVMDVEAPHRNDRLFARARQSGGYDLFLRADSDVRNMEKEILLLEDFADLAPEEHRQNTNHNVSSEGTWFNFGPAQSLTENSDWEFRTGFWPVEGVTGENKRTGQRIHRSLQTPFVAWVVRNSVHLEGDFLLAQVGNDQIVIFHLPSDRVALLARGKGPLAVKSKSIQG